MNAAERVTEGDIAPELVLKLNYAKALNAAPSGAQSDSVLGGWVSSFNRGPQECAIGLVLRGIFLDGTRIVTSWDNAARLWDAATGAELAVLQGPKVPLVSLAAYHDGTNVLILTVSVGPSAVVRDQGGTSYSSCKRPRPPG